MQGVSKNALDFFNTGFAVFGAPGRYLQGADVVELVGKCCATLSTCAVLLCDDVVAGLVGTRIEASCLDAGLVFSRIGFNGEMNAETGPALAAGIASAHSPVIIAAGGGRTIDAGKALRDELGCHLLTLPTVASNDSPTSKNYVLYDSQHRLVEVRHMPRNPDFVLVDTKIIAAAPRSFFLSGLGDAIAKKFEADQCFAAAGPTMFRARSTRTANSIANACYAQLIENAAEAYTAAGTGEPTEAFDAAVEAMILMAGLGFENGGLSISHALTRGLSNVRNANRAAHGLQVAYGLLVQLALEGKGYPADLLDLYRAVGLPMSLADLGVSNPDRADFEAIAAPSVLAPHIHNFSRPLTMVDLVEAMVGVEQQFGSQKAEKISAAL